MSFEIGDEVVGILSSDPHTFEKVCRVTDVQGPLLDVIVYDPDTKMWEDYDLTMVNLPADMFRLHARVGDVVVIREDIEGVLQFKDPYPAVAVLISRIRLQERYYGHEEAVAGCTFISREELIRQSAECLVRLAAASMAPYNEEVVMSKKKGQSDPEKKDDEPNKDAADVGPHHGAQQSGGNAKEDEVRQHELLPENFRNRTLDWCHGFVDRRLAGNVKGGSDAVLAKITDATPDYIDGWNKATNYIRSGGK